MSRHPTFERLRRRSSLAGLVLLGVLCRALIPVGFMPAAFGAGGPVAVCHGGLAGEFFRQLAAQTGAEPRDSAADAHAGHADHGGADGHAGHDSHAGQTSTDAAPAGAHEAWDHCPLGAAFGATAISAAFEFSLPQVHDELETIEPAIPALPQVVSSHRARAPPARPPLS